MNQKSQSIAFEKAPFLIGAASVAGSKEAEGPLGKLFDMTNQDDLFGAKIVGGSGKQYAEGSLYTCTWKGA